jgi:hypothetical protein
MVVPFGEAAQAYDLPLGIHSYGIGGHASTGGGWPSFYMEEHDATTMGGPAVMSSMVMEGVFEEFPALEVVLVEIGFAWVPSFAWRRDRLSERLGDEVPHLTHRLRTTSGKLLVHDAADGRARQAGSVAPLFRLARLGSPAVLDRLSALGPGRSVVKVKLSPAEQKQLCRGNAENLYRF